jgi:trigger factor
LPAEVKIEEIGPCKKRLKIQVPKEELQETLEETYADLVQSAVLPGFRRGRVPRKLLEKRFGDDVKEDVKQKVMAKTVRETLEKNQLSPVGEASYENVEFDVEKALSFDVTFEVLPTFEVPNYKGLKLNRKSAEPTDEDIYNAIQQLRQRAGVLTTMENTPAEKGDLVICDYEVRVGDQVAASATNAEIAADGMNVVGISPEPVAELLVGAKAEEKRSGKAILTEQFSREDLRGKEADVQFTVKEVKRLIMPDVNEEFAKKNGFDSLAEMKEFLQERVKTRKDEWVKADLERQACDELLTVTNFELPLDLVEHQTEENLLRRQARLMLRGIPPEQINREMNALRDASQEEAIRSFKVYLILEKIAEKEKIFATEDDVEERIVQTAMARKITPAQMKQRLEAERTMSALRSEIRHQKVLDFLVANGQIVDVKKSITDTSEEARKEEKPKKRAIILPGEIEEEGEADERET